MLKKMVTGLLALFLSATMAYAVEVGGVEIAETLDTNTGNLVFNGAGIRKKFGFKVYVGALYLKAKTSDSQAIINADENMAIQMTWKRNGKKLPFRTSSCRDRTPSYLQPCISSQEHRSSHFHHPWSKISAQN